jgi:hypothetical protein
MTTTMKLARETRDQLRVLKIQQSGRRKVQLTMESVLIGLLALADKYPDDLETLIPHDTADATEDRSLSTVPHLLKAGTGA